MAVAYESVSTTTWQARDPGENLVITKPTGLAVGDLMIAHLTVAYSGSATIYGGWSTPTGWTELTSTDNNTNSNSSVSLQTFWKIADSTDVAASNFSFPKGASAAPTCNGSIYRISGVSTLAASADSDSSTQTPTFTNTVTPTIADSLLLFLTSVSGTSGVSSQTTSIYAIATDNPTWTERVDTAGSSGTSYGSMAGATATRTAITATGNSTCSYSSSGSLNAIGVMIYITPATSVSTDATVLSITSSIQDPTITGSATMTATVADVTMTANTPTVTIPTPDFSNLSKSSSSWSNQAKS